MIVENITLENGTATGLRFVLQNAPMILVKADKGFVMCGYLNVELADRLGDVACKVSGVSDFDTLLKAEIVELTSRAQEVGIHIGMKSKDALEKMF